MITKFHLKKYVYSKLPNFNRRFFSTPTKVIEDVGTTSNENLSSRFHQIYLTELEKLEKSSYYNINFRNALVEAKYKVKPNTVPNEAYVHPYHSERFPVFWSSLNFSNSLHEAVGPEPVSPHFESYTMSRRAPICKIFNLISTSRSCMGLQSCRCIKLYDYVWTTCYISNLFSCCFRNLHF